MAQLPEALLGCFGTVAGFVASPIGEASILVVCLVPERSLGEIPVCVLGAGEEACCMVGLEAFSMAT